jgi:hypothetical protein
MRICRLRGDDNLMKINEIDQSITQIGVLLAPLA